MKSKLFAVILVVTLLFTSAGPVFADTIYTVRAGDTLYLISVRYGVSIAAIMNANGLTNANLIFVGQRLVIPDGAAPAPSQPTPPPSTGQRTYVVQPGDWLSRIATRFGVSLGALLAANGLSINSYIFPGQTLIIPGAGAPAPTSTPAPSQPTPAPTSSGGVYIVQPGDWLSRIASRFGVSLSALMAANGITNANLIYVGQRLIIPGAGAATPTPPPASTPVPTTTPVVPPPSGSGGFELGGHVDTFSFPDKMKYAGMYWVKHQIRWSPGMAASDVQGRITDAHAKGFKVLLGVVGHPGDISGGANYDSYAAFVGELARLGADAIEVWNEMNIDREWPAGQINPAAYTELLRRAYNQIKAKNANTLVISGAPAPTGAEGAFGLDHVWNDDRYIRGMAAAGAASYVDCIGVHYNEGVISPVQTSGDPRVPSDYYSRYYQSMVSLYYNTFGGARKLCFTELGYLTPEGFGPLPATFAWGADTSLAEQAQWLGEAANLAKNSGIVRILIVWNVDFRQYDADPMAGFSIVRPDGNCPACDKLRQVTGGR
jgi:LysM repeat protein